MNNAALFMSFFTGGKAIVPGNAEVAGNFDVKRYIGRWYEIARLDHPFERNLINVSAEYSTMPGGQIKIANQGYDPERKIWRKTLGKAKFASRPQTGQLLLSFFGPFYASYNIIELDTAGYSYAMVCGHNLNYLWIIARMTSMPEPLLSTLIEKAGKSGFETDKLIYVKHDESIQEPRVFGA